MMPTSNEESVSSKHCFVITIFEEITNTVLGMARSMQSRDIDSFSYGECRLVCRSLGDLYRIFAGYDRNSVMFQLFKFC
jgi:hypothetical protein